MVRVPWLRIWWRHDIWILEKIKFDYLKKEKSLQSEIKNIAFRRTKQTSKNVADTTFKNAFIKKTEKNRKVTDIGLEPTTT